MLIRGFPLYHKICLSEREFDKNMKLPNGYGSVVKMSGKRRKPYMVRKTIGWHLDKGKDRFRISSSSAMLKPELKV